MVSRILGKRKRSDLGKGSENEINSVKQESKRKLGKMQQFLTEARWANKILIRELGKNNAKNPKQTFSEPTQLWTSKFIIMSKLLK